MATATGKIPWTDRVLKILGCFVFLHFLVDRILCVAYLKGQHGWFSVAISSMLGLLQELCVISLMLLIIVFIRSTFSLINYAVGKFFVRGKKLDVCAATNLSPPLKWQRICHSILELFSCAASSLVCTVFISLPVADIKMVLTTSTRLDYGGIPSLLKSFEDVFGAAGFAMCWLLMSFVICFGITFSHRKYSTSGSYFMPVDTQQMTSGDNTQILPKLFDKADRMGQMVLLILVSTTLFSFQAGVDQLMSAEHEDVSTRSLLKNHLFDNSLLFSYSPSFLQRNPNLDDPIEMLRQVGVIKGGNEEYTLVTNKTVDGKSTTALPFWRKTHKYVGRKTFELRDTQSNTDESVPLDLLPHIIHVVLESVRAKDLQRFTKDGKFSATPIMTDLMNRGIFWTNIRTTNFHTSTGFAVLYVGGVPYFHPKDLKHMAYLRILTKKHGYRNSVFSDQGCGVGTYGFDNVYIQPNSDVASEYDDSFLNYAYGNIETLLANDTSPLYLEFRPEGTHPYWNQGKFVKELKDYPTIKEHFDNMETQANAEALYITDRFVGRLLDRFKNDKRRKRRTLVLVSADHGYGIGEHTMIKQVWYEEEYNIPFIIADLTDDESERDGVLDPSEWGRKIGMEVLGGNADILPTILDMLGTKDFEQIGTGKSLYREFVGSEMYHFSIFQGGRYDIMRRWRKIGEAKSRRCVPSEMEFMKIIRENATDTYEVYDLMIDPEESDNCHTPVHNTAPPQYIQDALNLYRRYRKAYEY